MIDHHGDVTIRSSVGQNWLHFMSRILPLITVHLAQLKHLLYSFDYSRWFCVCVWIVKDGVDINLRNSAKRVDDNSSSLYTWIKSFYIWVSWQQPLAVWTKCLFLLNLKKCLVSAEPKRNEKHTHFSPLTLNTGSIFLCEDFKYSTSARQI